MGEPAFRTIDGAAQRCGQYVWVERRLFDLAGARAAAGGDPGARVCLSVLSRRRALLAALWEERLPVRAGIDPEAFVAPPPGPLAAALELLGATPSAPDQLAGLVTVVFPRLLASYEEEGAGASPVSEAPTVAASGLSARVTREDIEEGRSVLERLDPGLRTVTIPTGICQELDRQFQGCSGVFPGA